MIHHPKTHQHKQTDMFDQRDGSFLTYSFSDQKENKENKENKEKYFQIAYFFHVLLIISSSIIEERL